MDLLQTQIQHLSQQQLLSIELLQLGSLELEAYIHGLAMSNPLVDPEQSPATPEPSRSDDLLGKLRWLEDNDHQNRYYQHIGAEELDPLALVSTDGGLEETLERFLFRQIDRLELSPQLDKLVRYLTGWLEDDGYFRVSPEEVSETSGHPVDQLEKALEILKSLEPAGVGAADLSECLALQLKRIGNNGPALTVVEHYLPLLAKRQHKLIATKMGVPLSEIILAEHIIQELEPHPGGIFQRPEQVPYILPDIYVEESEGTFTVRSRRSEQPAFQINGYYRNLLSQSDDPAVKEYLNQKLRQAENVLWAIGQRDRTLLLCAQAIVAHQQDFFIHGPLALRPLRMADVAEQLNLHESTISRTVKEKYLQCPRGIFPLGFFFSRRATADDTSAAMGGTAARALLRRLIEEENKSRPLSDQKLCEKMAQEGCPVSRRTVAKYRDEMNIPNAAYRKSI